MEAATRPRLLRRRAAPVQPACAVRRVVRLERRASTGTVATAIGAFLAEHDLNAGSRRVYAGALRALQEHLGADTALTVLDEPQAAAQLAGWFRRRYGRTAPATRVRQLAILRSACGFWRRRGWLSTDPTAGLERPRVPLDRTRALTREQLAALWRRDGVPLRERAFWRLLYESAARANELLSLDIEDLDLANKRARVSSKGGAVEWVFWQTGAALLLPRLLAGRTIGPVFLADRQPTRAVPTVDRCPLTGRARLSYRRAAQLFSQATAGWTLHQLRHSALTHAAEDGTSTPLLLARSRHASARSLERYARPSPEAVARELAERDPAPRRR
ncbi:MAG: site-specific integrase [Chloroflexi bacterium]|nr:site-specific integrase [Chloroflexota bacterium]